ncbi:hypothetical protein [Streptomyces sp. NPDC002547]
MTAPERERLSRQARVRQRGEQYKASTRLRRIPMPASPTNHQPLHIGHRTLGRR